MSDSFPQIRWGTPAIVGLLALATLVPFSFMPNARLGVGSHTVPLHFLLFVPAGALMLAFSVIRFYQDRRVPLFVWFSLMIVASMAVSSFVPASAREGLSTTAGVLFRCIAIGWFAFVVAREQGSQPLGAALAVLGAVVAAGALYEPMTGRYFIFTRAITYEQPGSELWEPWRRIAVGAIGQPLPLAALLNMFLPFALSEWQARRRWFWAIPSVLIVFAIFMTFRRSGYLIALVTCALYIYRAKESRRMIITVAGAVAVCVSAALFLPTPRRIFLDRFDVVQTLHEMKVSHRTRVYGTVASMASKNPLLGIGTRQYDHRYKEFAGYEHPVGTPDNQYLRLLAEGGIVGLGSFLAFLGFVLVRLWSDRDTGFPFLISVAGFTAAMMLLDGLYWPAAGLTFFAIAGAGVGRLERKEL